jgi:hypothetical protein
VVTAHVEEMIESLQDSVPKEDSSRIDVSFHLHLSQWLNMARLKMVTDNTKKT